MKHLAWTLPILTLLGACDTLQQSQLAGTVAGAAVGASVADDKTTGAMIGATAGLIAGTLIGESQTAGQCIYQYPDGQRYVAPCP